MSADLSLQAATMTGAKTALLISDATQSKGSDIASVCQSMLSEEANMLICLTAMIIRCSQCWALLFVYTQQCAPKHAH